MVVLFAFWGTIWYLLSPQDAELSPHRCEENRRDTRGAPAPPLLVFLLEKAKETPSGPGAVLPPLDPWEQCSSAFQTPGDRSCGRRFFHGSGAAAGFQMIQHTTVSLLFTSNLTSPLTWREVVVSGPGLGDRRTREAVTPDGPFKEPWFSLGPPGQPRVTCFLWGELTSSLNPGPAEWYSTPVGSKGEDSDTLGGAALSLPKGDSTEQTRPCGQLRLLKGPTDSTDTMLYPEHGTVIKNRNGSHRFPSLRPHAHRRFRHKNKRLKSVLTEAHEGTQTHVHPSTIYTASSGNMNLHILSTTPTKNQL